MHTHDCLGCKNSRVINFLIHTYIHTTVQGHHTAAAVVTSSSSSVRSAVHSLQLQTELTWPDGQDSPCTLNIASTAINNTATTQTDQQCDFC